MPNDDDAILAGLDFDSLPLTATDLIKPCPEGDACIYSDPAALLRTIYEAGIQLSNLAGTIITLAGRHGFPETANQVYALHLATIDAVKPTLLSLIDKIGGFGDVD